jgi:excisionase family DNA binding protein
MSEPTICLLTAEQVADRLCVTKQYVYKLGRRGLLPRVAMPGDVVRFAADDVEAFVAAHRQQGEPERPKSRRRASLAQVPARF